MNKKDDDWIEKSNRIIAKKIIEIGVPILVSVLTTVFTLQACGIIGR